MTGWKALRVLGKGTYATVYLAIVAAPHQVNRQFIAAIKSSGSETFSALQKEENILRSLFDCEEIVQCFFSQFTLVHGSLNYNLIMEFAPHGSLRDLIIKRPLFAYEVRVYTRMLLNGLCCIHRMGVVHCDLKPDNILLYPSSDHCADYRVKIADFGISKTSDEIINTEFWKLRFRGTPLYMSPESVAMGQISSALDIWSLGCIVIEMVTRSPAWSNHITTEALMSKLVQKEAPNIREELGQDCKDFLSKCFVKDPNKRWTAPMLLGHPFVTRHYDIFTGFETQYSFYNSSSYFSYDMIANGLMA
ncbi:hypothetical protein RIF29_41314 [Crotalaria pallida]|uniref:Protein kinase domain-containing protein n=1 Tax=Crotalaria pallida TaxID=3830 RepID=A0AAN9E660_CROPI